MADINDRIYLLGNKFVITQGIYNLTAAALLLRGQRPLYCGDDYVFDFELRDVNGNQVNLTGATIKMTVKKDVADSDPSAVFQKTATLTHPLQGQFTITIQDTDVTSKVAIFGYYNVQLTLGGLITTLISGDIEFLPNVT
jgi:hypothetical protein